MSQLHLALQVRTDHLVRHPVDMVAVTAAADPGDLAGLPTGGPAVTMGDQEDPHHRAGEAHALPAAAEEVEIRAQEVQAEWRSMVPGTTEPKPSSK